MMDFGKSICSAMSDVVFFAYQTSLNISERKRVRSVLQIKEVILSF
jgi:hypothetical protein